MPSDLVTSTWPISPSAAKQVFWDLFGVGSHQAFVECTLVMKHQGHPRQICLAFHKVFAYNYYVSDCWKVFLLVLGSFEIVFVKMYVIICVEKKPYNVNGKMTEKMINKKMIPVNKSVFRGQPIYVKFLKVCPLSYHCLPLPSKMCSNRYLWNKEFYWRFLYLHN